MWGTNMFEKLKNRYIIKGTVILDTALHIGSGQSSFEIDALVIKDAHGKPYIPGSSFKGSLRSTIERIVPNLNGFRTCALIKNANLFSIDAGFEDDLNKNNITDRLDDVFKTNGFSLSKEVAVAKIKDGKWIITDDENGGVYTVMKEDETLNIVPICDTCNLFGSTVVASKVKIPDLYVVGAHVGLFEKRDGVSIDRDTETAVEGAKFDYEVVPSQAVFELEMICENLDKRNKFLLSIGLREMQSGIVPLGGNKTRGLGAFRLVLKEISHLNFENKESLVNYLTSQELEQVEPENFIKEGIKTLLDGGEDDA